MTPISKTKAVLFGGATGDTGRYSITGDTYIFDMVANSWKRLDNITGIAPTPRAAHASTSVETFQMIIYGGATGGGSLASDDLYLLDLRSGEESATWMVVPIVGTTPGRRYGHTAVFSKPHLLTFGGNTGQETVNDIWCLNVERAPFSWTKLEISGECPATRVYHSAALCQFGSATGMMVIFGGRTSDQSALNDIWGLRRHRNGSWDWLRAPYKTNKALPSPRYQHSSLFVGSTLIVLGGRTNQVGESVPIDVYDTETSEWYKFPPFCRFRHTSWALDSRLYIHGGFEHEFPNVPTESTATIDIMRLFTRHEHLIPKELSDAMASQSNAMEEAKRTTPLTRTGNRTPDIRLANQVLVYLGRNEGPGEMIQKVSIDRLQSEGTRIGVKALPPSMIKPQNENEQIHNLIIGELLQPKFWKQLQSHMMDLSPEVIKALCEEVTQILKGESTVIHLRAPVKIFGDLYGQYIDLLRLFEMWGSPSEIVGEGDIEAFDYLFLGDYVDRGNRSLEVISLLFALKIKHPEQVFLLRGHHEDINVNMSGGFAEECRARLNDNPLDPNSVFATVNRVFNHLPLAAILEDKILCVHGGIGATLRTIDELEYIQRPIEIDPDANNPTQQILLDVLWSDPTPSEEDNQVYLNQARRDKVVKFGLDRLRQFLAENRLNMVIRGHETVAEGFDRYANGELITVCSCTNYCGINQNSAAMLIVKRTLEIVPKMVYHIASEVISWIDTPEGLQQRPPTPPRIKKSAR